MQNTKYVAFIIFIITSFHAIFGMDIPHLPKKPDAQDPASTITTPLFLVHQKSPTKPYVSCGDQMYQFLSRKGSVSLPQKDLPFAHQDRNECIIIRSAHSYGIFNRASNKLVLENFELTYEQLQKIESSYQTRLVIIWHAGQRYDICEIQKIDQSFGEQFLEYENQFQTCKKQLLLEKEKTADAMKLVDDYMETLAIYAKDDEMHKRSIKELTSKVTDLMQKLTTANTEIANIKEAHADLIAAKSILDEKHKNLESKFIKHTEKSNEKETHYKGVARDNIFLKGIFGLALLIALCNYCGLFSKIMSSFATSVQ